MAGANTSRGPPSRLVAVGVLSHSGKAQYEARRQGPISVATATRISCVGESQKAAWLGPRHDSRAPDLMETHSGTRFANTGNDKHNAALKNQ